MPDVWDRMNDKVFNGPASASATYIPSVGDPIANIRIIWFRPDLKVERDGFVTKYAHHVLQVRKSEVPLPCMNERLDVTEADGTRTLWKIKRDPMHGDDDADRRNWILELSPHA